MGGISGFEFPVSGCLFPDVSAGGGAYSYSET